MLRARSLPEARLFIARQPCPSCKAQGFTEPSRLVEHGEGLAVESHGYCPSCGHDRRFALALADDRVPPGAFGNSDPSTLIDAGEWMAIADEQSRGVPASAAGLDRDARARAASELALAISAVEEVKKFIPAGDDRVPRDAFFTSVGRDVSRADPARFTRLRLDAILEAWRGLAAVLAQG